MLEFIDEQFQDTVAEVQNLRAQGLVSFDILWTLFKPGTLVYTTMLGQPRVYQLQSYGYGFDQGAHCQVLNLNVSYVDFDGDNFGTMSDTVKIPDFQGGTSDTMCFYGLDSALVKYFSYFVIYVLRSYLRHLVE